MASGPRHLQPGYQLHEGPEWTLPTPHGDEPLLRAALIGDTLNSPRLWIRAQGDALLSAGDTGRLVADSVAFLAGVRSSLAHLN